MASFFDDQKLSLTCGQCGHKTQETVARLKASPQIACPQCGTVTEYDATQFRGELAKADKAIDDLKKAFKEFGK